MKAGELNPIVLPDITKYLETRAHNSTGGNNEMLFLKEYMILYPYIIIILNSNIYIPFFIING